MEIVRDTFGEEVANSVTHGIGTVLSIAALSVLVSLSAIQGDAWRVVSFSVYGATLVTLYLISTLYHSFRTPEVKQVFHVLDHAAIYLLIAGTYTPFALVSLRGGWGWTLFGIIWGLAFAGIVFKLFWFGRFKNLSLVIYVAMGWFVVIAFKPILVNFAIGSLAWLLIGGGIYTFGVAFYVWQKLPYHHAVWHLFVIGGSMCHFFAILFYVLPGK